MEAVRTNKADLRKLERFGFLNISIASIIGKAIDYPASPTYLSVPEQIFLDQHCNHRSSGRNTEFEKNPLHVSSNRPVTDI